MYLVVYETYNFVIFVPVNTFYKSNWNLRPDDYTALIYILFAQLFL